MTRTCLGSEKAWTGIDGYVPLNPVLLKAPVTRLVERKAALSDLGAVVTDEVSGLRERGVRGWDEKSFRLFDRTISLPQLDLDYEASSRFRNPALS